MVSLMDWIRKLLLCLQIILLLIPPPLRAFPPTPERQLDFVIDGRVEKILEELEAKAELLDNDCYADPEEQRNFHLLLARLSHIGSKCMGPSGTQNVVRDIAEFLTPESDWEIDNSLSSLSHYPLLEYNQDGELIPCKNWFTKGMKKAGKWIWNHKKEIAIAIAVIIVVIIIIYYWPTEGSTLATLLGAAAGAKEEGNASLYAEQEVFSVEDLSTRVDEEETSENLFTTYPEEEIFPIEDLSTRFDEDLYFVEEPEKMTSYFCDYLLEEDFSLGTDFQNTPQESIAHQRFREAFHTFSSKCLDFANDLGAEVFHTVWEEFSEMGILSESDVIEVKKIMYRIAPKSADHFGDLEPHWEEWQIQGHKTIDRLFAQKERSYKKPSPEELEERYKEFPQLRYFQNPTIGELPPPSRAISSLKKVANAAKTIRKAESIVVATEELSVTARSLKVAKETAALSRSPAVRIKGNIWEIEGKSIKRFDTDTAYKNKTNHVFKKARHQLDKLPYPENVVIDKVTQAVIEADQAGRVPLNKPFAIRVMVEGYEIEARGIVLDGELRYGTFFIPDGA